MEGFELENLRRQAKQGEDHIIVAFQRFQIRWGEIKNEDGEVTGILGEFFLPYLPWMKFRLPLTLVMADKIASDLRTLVDETQAS